MLGFPTLAGNSNNNSSISSINNILNNNTNTKELEQKYQECKNSCEILRNKLEEAKKGHNPYILKDISTNSEDKAGNFRTRKTLRGHFGKIYALHWGSSSKDIVSASQDGKLMLWNAISTNKKLAIPLRSAWVMTCAYSPESKFVACGGLDNLCSIFQISNDNVGWELKQTYRELQHHEGYLSCCRFLDEGHIITSSGDSTCILWDIETKTPKQQFIDHTGDVMSVDIYPEKNIFISGSTDATSKIWDLRANTGRCISTFTGHASDINSVTFFPDGNAFASGSDDSSCRLFDLRAQRQLNEYKSENVMSGVTSVCFSKSGYFLFAGYDEEPFCLSWNTLKGQYISALDHPQRVSSLQTSPDGYAIASGCWDCWLRIWA